MFLDLADPNVITYPSSSARWQATRRLAFEQDVKVRDPWALAFGGHEHATEEFKLLPQQLLQIARTKQPTIGNATASGFADWVYSLYRNAPSLEGMKQGSIAEGIFGPIPKIDENLGDIASSVWRLEYCGLGTHEDETASFVAPTLQILDMPLKCRPDFIYRHRHASIAVIVEAKCTSKPIPRTLWPNIWAQLWTYSKISDFNDIQRIIVLAEVWGLAEDVLVLRKVVRRDPRRKTFDSFFSEMFRIYKWHLEAT